MPQEKRTPVNGLTRHFKYPQCGATMSLGEWRTFDAVTNPPCEKCGVEMKSAVRKAPA